MSELGPWARHTETQIQSQEPHASLVQHCSGKPLPLKEKQAVFDKNVHGLHLYKIDMQ